MDVTHPQLVAALVKPPQDIIASLSQFTADIWHGATGVAGECGELLEGIMIAQSYRDEEELDKARVNIVEESGDIFFYTEQIVQRTGIIIDWDALDVWARQQHIGPDMMVTNAIHVVIYGSQVLDTVKKAAVYNKELDIDMLSQQLNDMCRFLLVLAYMFGFSREQALNANILKLKKRYDGLAYSDKAAQDRADKKPTAQGEVVPGYTPPERKFIGKDAPVGEPVRIPLSEAFEEREEKGI